MLHIVWQINLKKTHILNVFETVSVYIERKEQLTAIWFLCTAETGAGMWEDRAGVKGRFASCCTIRSSSIRRHWCRCSLTPLLLDTIIIKSQTPWHLFLLSVPLLLKKKKKIFRLHRSHTSDGCYALDILWRIFKTLKKLLLHTAFLLLQIVILYFKAV